MIRWLVAIGALVATGCPSKPAPTGQGSGTATPPPTTANAKTCADVKARIEQLYRVEAQNKEPKRVDEAVADNTAMVMTDCAKDPARFVPCIARAPSVADLE